MKKIFLPVLALMFILSTASYSQYFTFQVISPTVHFNLPPNGAPDTQQVKSFAIVNNTTSNAFQIQVTMSNVVRPSGWGAGGICTWLTCYPESLYVLPTQNCAPGRDTLDVYFSPHMISGNASCTVTITYSTQTTSQDFHFTLDPIGIRQISSTVNEFSLGQNYPNPFNPTTKVNFTLPKAEFTYLRVYDILGREVKTLVSEQLQAGEYQVDFDAKDLSSGMYYYSLRAGDYVSVKKMVLVK